MSLGGRAFYVIGVHPGASRKARRFGRAALVFNLHSQFETLREDGRYDKMRAAITERDIAFSGSRNPMLAGHGEASEGAPVQRARWSAHNGAAPSLPRREAEAHGRGDPATLRRGLRAASRAGLRVIDPEGEQVADLLAYNAADMGECSVRAQPRTTPPRFS
jgi:hypothetical protein